MCLLRWMREADMPSSGLLAGALAGLAALAYRSVVDAGYSGLLAALAYRFVVVAWYRSSQWPPGWTGLQVRDFSPHPKKEYGRMLGRV